MTTLDRRALFNTGAGLAVGMAVAGTLAPGPAAAQGAVPAGVKLPPYEVKPLPLVVRI